MARHTLDYAEFTGDASRGNLCYALDGQDYEVQGEFYYDNTTGAIHHEHWFDEEGKDTYEVVVTIRGVE